MSELIRGAFLEVIGMGQRIDTPLAGEEYLRSREKRLLDEYGVRVLSPVFLPFIVMARMAVMAEDGSPTVIQIPRVGRNGDEFPIKKIRSMVKGSERAAFDLHAKVKSDPRVTRIGAFIRKYSIDEMPQIRNVMRGEMSLVGPRPVNSLEFEYCSDLDAAYHQAYTATSPGLTGLEQINGRDTLSREARTEYALEYAEEACLALDIDILAKTAGVVYRADGAY